MKYKAISAVLVFAMLTSAACSDIPSDTPTEATTDSSSVDTTAEPEHTTTDTNTTSSSTSDVKIEGFSSPDGRYTVTPILVSEPNKFLPGSHSSYRFCFYDSKSGVELLTTEEAYTPIDENAPSELLNWSPTAALRQSRGARTRRTS